MGDADPPPSPKKLEPTALRFILESIPKFKDGQVNDVDKWVKRFTKKTDALVEADKLAVFERAIDLDSEAGMWRDALESDARTADWTAQQWLTEMKSRFGKSKAQRIREAALLKQGEDEPAAQYMERKMALVSAVQPDFEVQLDMLRDGIFYKYRDDYNMVALQVENLKDDPGEAKKAFVKTLDAIRQKHRYRRVEKKAFPAELEAHRDQAEAAEKSETDTGGKSVDLEQELEKQRVLLEQLLARPKDRQQKSNPGKRDLSAVICHRCNEAGHYARDCTAPFPVKRKNKQTSGNDSQRR